MARARLHSISRNDLDAYRMPSFQRNPGVTAIMGITNGRGAYALSHNAKKGLKKVGGAGCHGTAPKKYRTMGATKREQYAYPECWAYPVRVSKLPKESESHYKTRAAQRVKTAMTRYGQFGKRYTPAVKREIELNIAKAAKAVGLKSPKAMQYRDKYGVDGAKVLRFPGRKAAKKPTKAAPMRMAANRSSSMLYYRSASRRRGAGYRRNAAPPPARRHTGYAPPPGGWDVSSTLPRYGEGRLRGGTQRVSTAKGGYEKTPIAFDPMTGKPIYTKTALRAAVARAERGRKGKSTKGAKRTSSKGRKASMAKAKKKLTKAQRRAIALKNLAKARSAKRRKSGKKPASKKTRKTKRSHSSYVRAAKKAASTRRRKAGKKAAPKKGGKKRRSTLARQLAAARALNTRLKGGKKSKKRSSSKGRKSTAAMFATNRRRRRHYRRNEGGKGFLGSLTPYLKLGALALGGFAVHRLVTKPVASLAGSVVSPTWGNVLGGLAVAALGLYAVGKVKFLAKHGAGLKTGMLVSAGSMVLKNLLPDFANTVGLGGIESVSIGPRYAMSGFKQAMAGDPILQAAAGEYYSTGMGEYMSNDLYAAGPTGEYEMRKLDIMGDTGSYELQSMYGVGATPTVEFKPEQADSFLEAMAGVQDASTYIPHEAEQGIQSTESSFNAGIFDAGNVLSG